MTTTTEIAAAHDAPNTAPEARFDKLAPVAGLVALVAGIATIAGMALPESRELALGSYIFAFIFWICIALGFFGLSLLHHAVKGIWTSSTIRLYEAGGGPAMFGAFAALFVPILLGMGTLYEWTHLDVVNTDAVLRKKAPLLNSSVFIIGTVICFVLWILLSNFMRNSAQRQERSGDRKLEEGRSSWGAFGLVVFVLSVTFAFVYWGMSLEPHWFSSMYPVWFIVGQALAGLALATLIVCLNANKRPYNEVVSKNHLRDLGNMLFAFTMLWGYTSVSQYLIIWNGNIPEFTQYFVRRSDNWWNAIGMVTIVGQFLVPWFVLLAPRTKKDPMRLARICGWILVIRVVDVYLTIIPAVPFRPHTMRATYSPMPQWTDFVAFIFIGAVWFLVFSWQSRKAPLIPTFDNRLREAMSNAH